MTQHIISLLAGMGVGGLLAVMAFEGLSIPFPGIIFVLTCGYFLDLGWSDIPGVSLGMSLIYCLASFVPYWIGYKLQNPIRKRFRKKLMKAQKWFGKYGKASIALSRPFGFGNYISYVAGMGKIRWWEYGLLTILGIYPWCFVMLAASQLYKEGSAGFLLHFQLHRSEILFSLLAGVIIYGVFALLLGYNLTSSEKS